jgi:ABC-type spermidine/putrescine transport system permease subunit II
LKIPARSLRRVAEYSVLLLALLIAVGPLVSIVILSVSGQKGSTGFWSQTLGWYEVALRDPRMLGAAWSTVAVALPVGLLGAAAGFTCALTWWYPRGKYVVVAICFLVSAIPADIQSFALTRIGRFLGIHQSSLVLLVIAHVLWVLPYCAILIIAGLNCMKVSVVEAAAERGRHRWGVVLYGLLPLMWPSVLSAFLVAFLMSANEYDRTSHLSGGTELLSQFVYGRMMSGTDPSVYAIASLTVVLSILLSCVVACGIWWTRRNVNATQEAMRSVG